MLAPADEQPVGLQEIADHLKLSRQVVAQKAHWGYLLGFKLGREWRF